MQRRIGYALFFLSVLALAGCSGNAQVQIVRSPTSAPTSPTPYVPPPLSLYFSALTPISSQATTPTTRPSSTVSALDASTGQLRWAYTAGAQVQSVPVVDEDTLFVGANDQNVYALDIGDGSVRWKTNVGGQPHVITIQNGVLYGDIDQNTGSHYAPGPVFALSVGTGAVKWRSSISASFYGLVDGVVYAATTSNQLYALDADHGSVRWQFQMKAPFGGLKVAQGQVYVLSTQKSVGTPSVVLSVLNASTGAAQWSYPTDPKDLESLSLIGVENNVVYLISSELQNLATQPLALALNAADGSVVWQYQASAASTSFTVSALDNTTVYLGTNGGQMIALDAQAGSARWQTGVSHTLMNIDLLNNGVMYITVSGEGVTALKVSTGHIIWRYQSPDYVGISSARDAVLYGFSLSSSLNADNHNYILALEATDGTLLWRYDTGASSIFPVLN
jgi:outer membrane protein assembly factor BamB